MPKVKIPPVLRARTGGEAEVEAQVLEARRQGRDHVGQAADVRAGANLRTFAQMAFAEAFSRAAMKLPVKTKVVARLGETLAAEEK